MITWNPCDVIGGTFDGTTLSNDDLTCVCVGLINQGITRGTVGQASGKYYYEVHLDKFVVGSTIFALGLLPLSTTLPTFNTGSRPYISLQWASGGGTSVNASLYVNNVAVLANSSVVKLSQGHTICWAVDLDNKRLWVRMDNSLWNADASADPATDIGGFDISAISTPLAPFIELTVNATITANFGDSAFSYTVPSGFTSGWDGTGGTPGTHVPAPVATSGATDTSLAVSFSAPTGVTPTSYNIDYRTHPSGSWTSISTAASPHTLTGLNAGTKYDFRVQAVYSGGACGFSEISSASTKLTITTTSVNAVVSNSVTIAAANLSATGADAASAVAFTVTTPPAHGTLKVSGTPASSFTQADIDNGHLTYTENGDAATSDSFLFSVSSTNAATTTGAFALTISAKPLLDIANGGLNVAPNESAFIFSNHLSATGKDAPSAVTYTITTPPAHGNFEIGGEVVSSFTQADINAGDLIFVSTTQPVYTPGRDAVTVETAVFSVTSPSMDVSVGTFAVNVMDLGFSFVGAFSGVSDIACEPGECEIDFVDAACETATAPGGKKVC